MIRLNLRVWENIASLFTNRIYSSINIDLSFSHNNILLTRVYMARIAYQIYFQIFDTLLFEQIILSIFLCFSGIQKLLFSYLFVSKDLDELTSFCNGIAVVSFEFSI